ncbi:GNAT family N-acetyltransferase [uncultured Sphingomonas sp.]|uniref:GNAT family N-acetyltransferase n=1 Tax=uncultured Sphingomonas sp. TaxID=158754 RepID=UPI002622B857|nr:GNAT family N-acetyltransferase [uncultured Sphingomonas sp.]
MFARTKRLTLRPWWPEDAETLTRTIAHEAIAMKLARMPWPYARTDAEAFLSLPRGAAEPRFAILAHDGDYPRLIGSIGLRREGGVHELGYWLTPGAWGHGYATEAGRMIVEIARHALAVKRIEASHHLDNAASRKVLTKLGFREVRREPHYSLARGGDVDCAVLALDLDDGEDMASFPIAA